jgi:nucleoside phosphorylase
MSDPEDYTVGWICAIDTEYTAAQKFFEKKHAPLCRRAANDTNHYTLGEINGHDFVMAVLPHGEYGTNSAASVVANMRNSFPKIQFGLMVGIGGGAPNDKHDIRLGDIVVSSPKDGSPGVYHHDFGKMIQGLPFVHTGFLNPPPRGVRSVINGLSSKYRGEGHHASILQTWPLLEEDYSRPARESDRLFASEFVHTSKTTCEESCATRLEKIITRRTRKVNNGGPYIHYSIIASGNQLIKDAMMRDRYAEEKDVLCFEMEAAGIMNDFPSLII